MWRAPRLRGALHFCHTFRGIASLEGLSGRTIHDDGSQSSQVEGGATTDPRELLVSFFKRGLACLPTWHASASSRTLKRTQQCQRLWNSPERLEFSRLADASLVLAGGQKNKNPA